MKFLRLVLVVVMLLLWLSSGAQNTPGIKLKNYSSALNNIRELKPVEKLYLQTDKPYYNTGDTLRFKAYLLNGDYLTPSEMSGLLYVELDNEQGKSTKRVMVPLEVGLAWGNIALDTAEIPDGTYTLRAYTNWMRNFGQEYIFDKSIHIARYTDNPLLVKAAFKQNGDKVEAKLLFNYLNGSQLSFKDVGLKVMNGRKNLSKDKMTTGPDGSLEFNFNTPPGAGALSIQATAPGANMLNIPISINRSESTDVQFMPEGGQLVAALNTKIGFKAIGEDGKGVKVSGKVVDSKGNPVATFTAMHAGMGSFEFIPVAGETYSAKVEGINKSYPLPQVKPGGTVLAITQTGADSLQIRLYCTPDAKGSYAIVAQANGVVCYASVVDIDGFARVTVNRRLFPTGVARFTLLKGNQPLNERIAFINHNDELKVSVNPHRPLYGMRDSIALDITVKDKDGAPVQGNFSLAVTDHDQVKLNSLGGNILNRFLLTADLKGDVEAPAYYFTGNKTAELDNLMLTQGWVGYDWQEAFNPKLPYPFKPEKELLVEGKVTTAFGSPIESSNIILFATNPPTVKDTLTDQMGRFVFKDLFPVDTAAVFKLQARNKRGKEMNVKIDLNENKPPVFGAAPFTTPWYLNVDSTLLNATKAKIAQENALLSFKGEGNVLKTVDIKSKKIIRGSKNLNGPGEADFFIDEEEIKAMPSKKSLEDMLRDKFPTFVPQGGVWFWKLITGGHGSSPLSYVWKGKKMRFVFDGIDLDFFFTPMGNVVDSRYLNIKQVLDYYTAQDIVGIEVMEQTKFSSQYHATMGLNKNNMMTEDSYVFIEITTRAKQGPFMKVTPGTAIYKATPFSIAKQFYSPKYSPANKNVAIGTDLRSTIFWEPNIFTNKEGKATVWFYSADKAAKYNVIVEGTDMEGALGFGTQQLNVR